MIMNFLRGIADAVSQSGAAEGTYDASRLTHYRWRCECGAHSREGGFLFEADAEYAAQQHQWRKGVGHPMPETHSTDGI